ncbi:MAG: ribonuclease R [Melioribacteraceae bacterium]|nr:ribonuclease R [Melioribacteraceae bacterium]
MKEKIKSFFKKYPANKIKSKTLAKKLGYSEPHTYAQMKAVLHDLFDEGYLARQGKRYYLNKFSSKNLVGRVQMIKDGSYAFVELEDNAFGDVFIPEKFLNTALNGDIVEVSLFAKQRGKSIEGEIIKVIERKRTEYVGILSKEKAFYFVEVDDSNIHRDFYVPSDDLNSAKNGDKVIIHEIEWTNPQLNPTAKVKQVLGKAGSYDAEIASIAHEKGLRFIFPDEVILEAEKIKLNIPQSELDSRMDLRDEKIFTIDPEDAKDFDDAVSISKLDNGNFRVGIHIADVSHYVNKGNAIYTEAVERATSIYFVGKVIPMLPEHLSNKICSLVPNEDRLTFSVIAEVSPDGKLVDYKISKSVINSKRRFNYDEVQEILDSGKGDFFEKLTELNNLAKVLRKKRMDQGSINFITPEVKFELDENNIPVNVKIKKVKESHQLIEEYMLLANQIVAKFINTDTSEPEPFIYRVHDLPEQEKLVEFSIFVRSLGYSFDPESGKSSKQLSKFLDEIKDSPEESLINEIAIRSMAKAIYSTDNIGHYGLGFSHYSHFTSPIRRLPDLIIHQILFSKLKNKKRPYTYKELVKLSEHSSRQERAAVDAERLSVKIKQIEYLQNKIGDEFEAVISGITNFGLFVELKESLAEGLIKMRDLEDDYYVFDEKNYLLRGRRNGKKYRLGDSLNVKLIRVDKEKREIDFALLSD